MDVQLRGLLLKFLSMRSPNTRRSYLTTWHEWIHFCIEDGRCLPELAGCAEVIAYVAKLKDRIGPDGEHLGDTTIRHKFHTLRSIYGFLYDMGAVKENPWRKAGRIISWRQQIQKRPTKLLDESLIYKIISSQKTTTKRGLQNAALLSFLFGGGLRRGEVVKIKLRDVSFRQDRSCVVILTQTKAGKVQTQLLPSWAGRVIYKLIAERVEEGAESDDSLFITSHGTTMCDYTLYRRYKKILAAHGIEAAPHSARASAATTLKRRGYEDRDVAIFLRHNTTQQVQVYDKRSRETEQNPGQWISYGVRKKVRKKRRKVLPS